MNIRLFKLILMTILIIVHITESRSQNWFPMEVGNRWDYDIDQYCHGNLWTHYTATTKIVGKENFGTEKEYYVFSSIRIYDHKILRHKILRIENDSLYAFNIEDSTECLLLAFNLEVNTLYQASCLEDSVAYYNNGNRNYFGFPDSQQSHRSGYIWIDISKKFGLVSSDEIQGGGVCETWYGLTGCIISDTTYGVLLDIDELKNDNHIAFQLHQNYPNPFNPTTKIKYTIPSVDTRHASSLQIVTLKVYDVLGNEVATLVNEEKPAGEYEVEFTVGQDSSPDIASGIYFYQLKVGAFNQTKKMILLK